MRKLFGSPMKFLGEMKGMPPCYRAAAAGLVAGRATAEVGLVCVLVVLALALLLCALALATAPFDPPAASYALGRGGEALRRLAAGLRKRAGLR
jgi:hypothetical protein